MISIRNLLAVTALLTVIPPISFGQDMVRQQFIENTRQDLLASCSDKAFIRCIGAQRIACTNHVNAVVDQCSKVAPAKITEQNVDRFADSYGNCITRGLTTGLKITEQRIDQCDTGLEGGPGADRLSTRGF